MIVVQGTAGGGVVFSGDTTVLLAPGRVLVIVDWRVMVEV